MKVNVFSLDLCVCGGGGFCSLILSWSETDYNWQSVEWLGPASDALGDFLVTIAGDMITLPHCHHHTTEKTGARYQMFRQEIDSKLAKNNFISKQDNDSSDGCLAKTVYVSYWTHFKYFIVM